MRSNFIKRATLAAAATIGLSASAQALTVGGITFDSNAFADSLVSSSGSWTVGGGTSDLETALIGSTTSDFAFSFSPGANVVLGFDDNHIINGAGDDIAVFELGSTETFSLAVNVGGTTLDFNAVNTGESSGGFSLLVATIDLDLFGIAPNATVSTVQLFPLVGGDPADFTAVGAINSVAPIPLPAGLPLLGAGLLALGLARRHRRKS